MPALHWHLAPALLQALALFALLMAAGEAWRWRTRTQPKRARVPAGARTANP